MCCQCRFRFWSHPVSSRLLILPICRLLHFDGANTPLCAAAAVCCIAAGGEMLRECPGSAAADICFYGGRWITSSPPAAATTASPSIIAYFPIFWGHISASAFILQHVSMKVREYLVLGGLHPMFAWFLALSFPCYLWTFSCVSSLWTGWHQDRETEFLCRKIMRLAAWICIMAVILWILAKMALL